MKIIRENNYSMMDSYLGYDVSDTSVQKDQAYFDRLPSPDSWSNWGICGFGPAYDFDDGSKIMSELSDKRPPYQPGAEMSFGSSSRVGSHEDSWPWNLQIDVLTGTEFMDDIVLSSLILDDAPATTNNYNPISPNSQSEPATMPAHSDSSGRMLDIQNMDCDTDNSTLLQSSPFSTSDGSNNGRSSIPNVISHDYSLDKIHTRSIKAPETMDMHFSDQGAGCDDSLTEESVLLGLEAVLNQLSSETRLCFRDSLYRLAQCSQASTSAGFSAEYSLDRSTRTTAGESETNVIDRVVANLMLQTPDGQCRCT